MELDGEAELTSSEYPVVLDLSLAWDLPGPTKENRKWLFERLYHMRYCCLFCLSFVFFPFCLINIKTC